MIRLGSIVATIAALAAAAPAAAADTPRPPATAGGPIAAGDAAAAPKVRASHRIDVIAPGERVDTVLDRARAAGPTGPRAATGTVPLPVRAPDRRGAPPAPPESFRPGTMPPPGGTAGGGGTTVGPPRGEMPPPERPRRR